MASLQYIQLYVSDYLSDTAHLSTTEHGAYLLLIFNYWQRGESFKAKDERSLNKRLACVARMTEHEWENVKETLAEFFDVSETEWIHNQIESDLIIAKNKVVGDNKRPSAEVWAKLRSAVFERDSYTCKYCGSHGARLECDHVMPVSKGGSHDLLNLVTACFQCNRSKRDLDLKDWLESRNG